MLTRSSCNATHKRHHNIIIQLCRNNTCKRLEYLESIYTMLCLLIPNQAIAAVVCIALFFILAPVAGGLNHALRQEAMIREFLNLVDGRPVYSDPIPNPQYISGLKRTVFAFLLDLTPFGQGALLSNVEAERVSRFPALSLLFSALCTGCGLLAFSRKNIK